jgi:hypothetical protein
MTDELDELLVSVSCPSCARSIAAPFGQVRTVGAVACACGALIIADTHNSDVASAQRLVDEAEAE